MRVDITRRICPVSNVSILAVDHPFPAYQRCVQILLVAARFAQPIRFDVGNRYTVTAYDERTLSRFTKVIILSLLTRMDGKGTVLASRKQLRLHLEA